MGQLTSGLNADLSSRNASKVVAQRPGEGCPSRRYRPLTTLQPTVPFNRCVVSRYKSIICQEDAYFKGLVRYIHLNPLLAKIVPDLDGLNKYPYSGHRAPMANPKRAWQETDDVLSVFGNTWAAAWRRYADCVKAGYGQGR